MTDMKRETADTAEAIQAFTAFESTQPDSATAQSTDARNAADEPREDIERVRDLPVVLTVELGRTRLEIGKLLQLGQGSVIELDGFAGEPLDVLVNGYLIARGEVVMVDDRFGIRLTDVVTSAERMRNLGR